MFSNYAKALATLGMITLAFMTNVLSNFVPINGKNVGEISNTVFKDVLLTPANYAFSIWGLIYLGVFAFGIYQLSPAERHHPKLNPLRMLMMLACGAQMLWIIVFLLGQYPLSLLMMTLIWVTLLIGYFKILGLSPLSRKQAWNLKIPWSIYFSWISVATIVNVALTLFALNWNGGGVSPEMWTVGLLVAAMVIGIIVVWTQGDIAFSGVFIWALIAIAIRHSDYPMLFNVGLGSAIALSAVSIFRGFLHQAK